MMMNKKFWTTVFTLTGAIIGAGILGLPYVFSKAGFILGLFWLIFLGLIIILVNLYLGEICLRVNEENYQLVGYARKYLGKWAEKIIFIAMMFGIYSPLIAYLIGEGQSFSQILPGNINPLFLGTGFWFVMTLLLKKGMRELRKVETYGSLAIVFIATIIFIYLAPTIKFSNFQQVHYNNFFLPFGVILFSLLGLVSIPELRREIKGQEKLLKKAIIIGTLIPIILYMFFSAVFVGVLGENVKEVATLSFSGVKGNLIALFGIFTMLTSYFVLSFSLRDMFRFDLRFSRSKTFFWVSLFPLLLYLVVSIFNLADFISILGIGGVVSGGLMGILILLINKKAKQMKERKPEYNIPINWLIISVVSIIFILGIIFEFLF